MDNIDLVAEMLFNERMNQNTETKKGFPQLRSVARISQIPVVETGWQYASGIYNKIKGSNSLVAWSLGTAESTVQAAVEKTIPIVNVFEKPLSLVDTIVCKSLDLVEERVPVVTLPPELILVSGKEYVSNSIVQPVLKRADSVKQFGLDQANHVLESKYTEFAASQIDNALDLADKYVEKYLPASGQEEANIKGINNLGNSRAAQTIQHVEIFSRKLQRRLTQRTLYEAQAFKQGGEDLLQNLLNIAELLARDPKAVFAMAKDLWAQLSKDEPENQTPPANLEEMTVMLTRESARRVVHLINYTQQGITNLPETLSIKMHTVILYCNQLTDTLLKAVHFEDAKYIIISQAKEQVAKIQALLDEINSYSNQIIELVTQLAGNTSKASSKPPKRPAKPSPKIQNGTNLQVQNHLDKID
ncbi:Lipid storage droplets surface-binding protein 1 [Gryllus bimaculatus]|nr:Lipid storage droplets surface-binding protein 1 [Gryllus bimaculatus]